MQANTTNQAGPAGRAKGRANAAYKREYRRAFLAREHDPVSVAYRAYDAALKLKKEVTA